MNINITEKAKQELKNIEVGGEKFLRIEVVSGGCSGLTYGAGIDTDFHKDDVVLFQDNDFRVVADMRSALYLDGLHIDYSDDLIRSGFRFSNPRAKKSCGCGSSFSA
ncbi:Iron-sulfur cluster insertion protein ErpA [Candidatus Zixiibacteriota bacterium]|nr:Iron-sulfur cluster insertion protein ErpA [candidate division Zixibacteria bacterium]